MTPFHARIEGTRDVKNYADFLVSEAAPSIMAWIIEGTKKVIGRNFHIPCPACVEGAIKSYNWLGHFLGECCEVAANYTEKSGELYRAYRCCCAQTGEYARSTADFYNVGMAGFSRRRTKAGITVYGLRLQDEEVGG